MEKTIKLEKTEIVVSKLPIGKYAQLLKALQELPKKLGSFQDLDNKKLLENLPAIVGDSLGDFLRIIEVATPLKMEEVEALGLSEVIDILIAIFEVNNYSEVFNKVKKMIPTGVKPVKK